VAVAAAAAAGAAAAAAVEIAGRLAEPPTLEKPGAIRAASEHIELAQPAPSNPECR
jgi:hypothetical protein